MYLHLVRTVELFLKGANLRAVIPVANIDRNQATFVDQTKALWLIMEEVCIAVENTKDTRA